MAMRSLIKKNYLSLEYREQFRSYNIIRNIANEYFSKLSEILYVSVISALVHCICTFGYAFKQPLVYIIHTCLQKKPDLEDMQCVCHQTSWTQI